MLQAAVPGIPGPNARRGDTLIRVPECPPLRGIRVFRAGLQIAEIRGKNLIPEHAAALGFPQDTRIRTETLDAERTVRYIAGEEIPGTAAGWTVLTYRGLALGWGKGSSGTLKNHYPKGLRKDRILTDPETRTRDSR